MTAYAPSVTFLIAAHNAGATIQEAVESTLDQDYEGPVRTLVVDDGSVDNTAEVVRAVGEAKLVSLPVNRGRSEARNVGLSLISSDLVAIQDADDTSYPWRLSRCVAAMMDGATSIIGGGIDYRDEDGRTYAGASWPEVDHFAAMDLLRAGRMPFPHPTLIAPTRLMRQIGGYSPNFRVAEDLDLLLRLSRVGRMNALSEIVCTYTRPPVDRLRYALDAERGRREVMRCHGLRRDRVPAPLTVAEHVLRSSLRNKIR